MRQTYNRKKEEKRARWKIKIAEVNSETTFWNLDRRESRKRKKDTTEIKDEDWVRHFKELLGGGEVNEVGDIEVRDWSANDEQEITNEEVMVAIKKLKKNKAAGIDDTGNEVWLYAPKGLIDKLRMLFNKIWMGGKMPEEWRKAIICPIFKAGEREDVKNYRGISLLPSAYKIYATILEKRLNEVVEGKKILPESQAGFRKGRGTIDNIYNLHTLAEQEISKKKGKLFAFFVDLKAAFDLKGQSSQK